MIADVFPQGGSSLFHVVGDDEELTCYVLPDEGRLPANLSWWLRRKSIRESAPQETGSNIVDATDRSQLKTSSVACLASLASSADGWNHSSG